MSLKRLLGGIISVAAPFVAPQISSFLGLTNLLGATAGSALSGATLGGLGAKLGGYNPMMGAAMGGLGGGIAGYMTPTTLPGASPAPAAAPATTVTAYGATGQGAPPPAPAPTASTTVAPPPGNDWGETFRRGLQTSSMAAGLGQLGMAALSSGNVGLTPAERAAMAEAAQGAQTNRQLFDQRLGLINRELSSTGFSPERAFSQAQMATQRALRDAQRGRPEGMSAAARRSAAIEGTRLGTAAVGEAGTRERQQRQGLINSMPTAVPTGPAGLTLPIAEKAQTRQTEFDETLGRGVGQVVGAMMGPGAYRV